MIVLDKVWLLPLLPLLGALAMLVGGRRWRAVPRLVMTLCCGTVGLSFLLTLVATAELAGPGWPRLETVVLPWFAGLPFGNGKSLTADWGFLFDPLAAVLALVITGVGFLIHVYSAGYLHRTPSLYRFYGALNAFVGLMLLLVLANNGLLLFAGWEGVGLCSYLLIGYYTQKPSANAAAIKAFVVNRVGDAGLLLGLMLLFVQFGTVQFTALQGVVSGAPVGVLNAIALLLLVGTMGKSAQFPLFVWLPDAMEGPTPVSALIHAATMVTAGVYLIARMSFLYALTPGVMVLMAFLGALTALLAATAALAQTDIKRVLAWSTVSQLGYMFMALGTGATTAALFHLFTHAFFKALLFLAAGSVIHALGGKQDLLRMGGLRHKLPTTFRLMMVGALALAGVPGLAGFFSKDEILAAVFRAPGLMAVYVVGLATAFLTALYMGRLIGLVFSGEFRGTAEVWSHAHESPRTMTLPLWALAVATVLVGWIGLPPHWTLFNDTFRMFGSWFGPVFGYPEAPDVAARATEWALMGASVLATVAGLAVAGLWWVGGWSSGVQMGGGRAVAGQWYSRGGFPGARIGWSVVQAAAHGWYVDRLLGAVFARGLAGWGARVVARFDGGVVDGGVNGAGALARLLSRVSGWWDYRVVDGVVRMASLLVRTASYPARAVQGGRVHGYALVFALGVLVLFGVYLTR